MVIVYHTPRLVKCGVAASWPKLHQFGNECQLVLFHSGSEAFLCLGNGPVWCVVRSMTGSTRRDQVPVLAVPWIAIEVHGREPDGAHRGEIEERLTDSTPAAAVSCTNVPAHCRPINWVAPGINHRCFTLVRVEDGTVREARVAVGSVGPVPVRATEAEGLLTGISADDPDPSIVEAAARAAAEAPGATEDLNGSAAYKRNLVGVMVRRGLTGALAQVVGAL